MSAALLELVEPADFLLAQNAGFPEEDGNHQDVLGSF